MRMLLPLVERRERAEWHARCRSRKADFPFSYTRMPDGRIKTQQVIEALNLGLIN